MTFTGFTGADFDSFLIEGLAPRMAAIQERIQPKFRALGAELLPYVSAVSGEDMHLHIARHARRKVNAPVDTWMAFSRSKRGYKQLPHFQIGLFDDRLFLWLALIYELPHKAAIASAILRRADDTLLRLPAGFAVSFDHMKKESAMLGELTRDELLGGIARFRDVKSCELLVGRSIPKQEPDLADGKAFLALAEDTFGRLGELYRIATRA